VVLKKRTIVFYPIKLWWLFDYDYLEVFVAGQIASSVYIFYAKYTQVRECKLNICQKVYIMMLLSLISAIKLKSQLKNYMYKSTNQQNT